MKLSFLLSVALGIMIVVAAALVWFVLDSMQVFADIEDLLVSIGSESFLQLMDYLAFDRVMSFATIVGVVDILLLTALGTIGAFLYNIVAALVGGLHMTLTDVTRSREPRHPAPYRFGTSAASGIVLLARTAHAPPEEILRSRRVGGGL
ncbi:DUF3566 domain-containing protein [Georgenia sp. SUBG003]|uniref:DUF3566 domain-containing protein n=1 Tax=Georgenia sp. SUBG003 TaxID=1497974 RepID=UPI003AB79175